MVAKHHQLSDAAQIDLQQSERNAGHRAAQLSAEKAAEVATDGQ